MEMSQMLKMKKERKQFDHPRNRSQSEDLYDNYNFEEEMKCDESIEEFSYFTSSIDDSEYHFYQIERESCKCPQCQQFITEMDGKDLDADMKKRIKRREYKKRQKLKAQQKKEQALNDLSLIIGQIYQLKTDYETEHDKIEECLKAIEKNVTRFYDFINAVIREQVETIKKEMRICLMELASPNPNFAKVPRLYEQFMKVKDGSPEVEKIINRFIDIISEKTEEVTRYQKNLDKKTFRFLLISDVQNRNAFLQVIKIIEEGNIKYEREKEMLRMIIEMIREKNISSSCSSSEQESDDEDSQESYDESNISTSENTTQIGEQMGEFEEDNEVYEEEEKEDHNEEKKNVRRKRKNKGLKHYEASFEKTYENLINLEKTLSYKIDERLPCNVEEEWLESFREKYLKKSPKLSELTRI